jgi:hypothetical protein
MKPSPLRDTVIPIASGTKLSGEYQEDPPPPYDKLGPTIPTDFEGGEAKGKRPIRTSPFANLHGFQHIPQAFRPFVVGALLMTIILLATMLLMPDMRTKTNPPPIQWVSKMTTAVHVHWGKEHQDDELVKRYVTAVVTSPFAKPPRNYLSICAIVRNEEVCCQTRRLLITTINLAIILSTTLKSGSGTIICWGSTIFTCTTTSRPTRRGRS